MKKTRIAVLQEQYLSSSNIVSDVYVLQRVDFAFLQVCCDFGTASTITLVLSVELRMSYLSSRSTSPMVSSTRQNTNLSKSGLDTLCKHKIVELGYAICQHVPIEREFVDAVSFWKIRGNLLSADRFKCSTLISKYLLQPTC